MPSLIFKSPLVPMFLFFLFATLVLADVRSLTRQDIRSINKTENGVPMPVLIFIYYERQNFKCRSCDEFKEELHKLSIPVRTLNFAEDVVLGSRFLEYSFPCFIVRSDGRSYVINPQSVEELVNMIENQKWKDVKPVRKIIDADSMFAIVFSYVNRVIYTGVMFFRKMMNYVPEYVVNIFILGVIAFLIYSIVDVLKREDVKVKMD